MCNSSLILQKLLSTNAYLGHRISTSDLPGYLYGLRNEIAIIDLEKTLICLQKACKLLASIIRSKESHLLLVNINNPVYNKVIQQTAKRTNQSYINDKWMGGFLTNWEHMEDVQQHFQDLSEDPQFQDAFTSSLFSLLRFRKMQNCFEGIMTHCIPNCLVIINANLNSMAILEADKLQIPIISLVDSNIPNRLHELITYPIPVNDDSIRFVYLFCNLITETVILSQTQRTQKKREPRKPRKPSNKKKNDYGYTKAKKERERYDQ